MEDLISISIDGLIPATRKLVKRFREANRKLKYLEIVQFAVGKGTACRARNPRGGMDAPITCSKAQSFRRQLKVNVMEQEGETHSAARNGHFRIWSECYGSSEHRQG